MTKELKALSDLAEQALEDTNFKAYTIEELDIKDRMTQANIKTIQNYNIIRSVLEVNKKKLDLIDEILVNIEIGAINFEVAIDKIREVLS